MIHMCHLCGQTLDTSKIHITCPNDVCYMSEYAFIKPIMMIAMRNEIVYYCIFFKENDHVIKIQSCQSQNFTQYGIDYKNVIKIKRFYPLYFDDNFLIQANKIIDSVKGLLVFN